MAIELITVVCNALLVLIGCVFFLLLLGPADFDRRPFLAYAALQCAAGVMSIVMIVGWDVSPPRRWTVALCIVMHVILVLPNAVAAVSFIFRPDAEVLLMMPLTLPSALMFLCIANERRSRPRPAHCPQCNYDLAGLIATTCPECGNPISPSTHAPAAPPPPPPPRSPDPPPPPS